MLVSDLELAKLAFSEASRRQKLPSDMLEEAKYYVDQGFRVLSQRSTYDPRKFATSLAKDAVVAYARDRLLGVIGDTNEFVNLATTWTRAAAVEYRLENVEVDEWEEEDQ